MQTTVQHARHTAPRFDFGAESGDISFATPANPEALPRPLTVAGLDPSLTPTYTIWAGKAEPLTSASGG